MFRLLQTSRDLLASPGDRENLKIVGIYRMICKALYSDVRFCISTGGVEP